MRKIYSLLIFSTVFFIGAKAQTGKGHDIKFNIKGLKDSTMYLARYYFDQTSIIDSCKHIKNGAVRFKGDDDLDRGVYILATQQRGRFIEFFVNDSQKLTITCDFADPIASLNSADSKENSQLFSYAKFMVNADKEYKKALEESKSKSKADSAKFISDKITAINDEAKKFDIDFTARNKGTFLADFMNLRTEKVATDIPKASNGRPDSVYQYYYYKQHYFDGVNFKDDRTMNTPFFADRIKKYFDQVIVQQPDSVIREIDKIMHSTVEGGNIYLALLGYLTYKYESNKTMSFDVHGNTTTFEKVFIHLSDNYITNGKAFGYYSDETVEKIKERINILRNLQPNAKVSDLFMIDTTNGKQVLKMGFDTAKTSSSVTYLYEKNATKLQPMFKTLYNVNAKYTILVFWAADCGHCQTEIPKLNADLKELKGKVDYKVFAVQTKEELYDSWKKFIIEKKLTDFIHVFDPMHLNNTKERFDITGTPVIYLLDRDKRIKGKKLSADQVVDIIKNLEKIEKKP